MTIKLKWGGTPEELLEPPESKTVQRAQLTEEQGPEHEFGCDHPEKPHVFRLTHYHDCCHACLLAAVAAGAEQDMRYVMEWRLAEFGEAAP